MEFLYTKIPQVEFDNSYALILAVMSNNKAEIVKLNGCVAIASTDEDANNVYVVRFTSVPYTL